MFGTGHWDIVTEKYADLFLVPVACAFYVLRISNYSMKKIIINHFHIHGDYITFVGNERSQGSLNDAVVQPNDEPAAPNDARCADILPIPAEGNYTAVRKYIEERVRFDEEFRTFVSNKSRVALCQRLSGVFGWTVDHYALGRNINRNRR